MKTLVSFLFMLTALCATAQVVQVSNPSKLPAKSGKFKVIGQNSDGVIVRLYGMEDVIQVYGDEMKLVTTKTISFKNQNGPLQYIMLNKTGAVIFYLQQDRKYSLLWAQPVNGKFIEIGKPILIDSIVDRRELVASNLRFKQSVDQSYMMVYYPYFSAIGNIEAVRFVCVDQGLKVRYNKTAIVNRPEKELENSKTLIDNQGNMFILFRPETDNNTVRYDVIRLDGEGNMTDYSIATEQRLFGEPYFDIDNKNGNLVMAGFFDAGRGESEAAANGFLYASYDPANGTLVKKQYTAFTKQFIGELTGRENVTNLSLYTFNIRRCMLRNDGGTLIVAESFIKDSRETAVPMSFQPGYNNTSYRTTEIFQFNDIIAFSLKPDGVMDWSSILRKKQTSEDDNGAYSSFLIMNEKDKLHFIYLDDVSNSGVLNEYVLQSEGRSNRVTLFNQEERDLLVLPKMGKQISPNQVVLPSYKGNTLRLVKIIY